jgi:hypothetical protein
MHKMLYEVNSILKKARSIESPYIGGGGGRRNDSNPNSGCHIKISA